MTPTTVPPLDHGSAVTFAADQPEYEPLPAWRTDDGTVITRWSLTWRERIRLLFGRPIWLYVLTFGAPLQPVLPTLDPPPASPEKEPGK